jgi:diguanylate cyclase (GGDEF)-like protein
MPVSLFKLNSSKTTEIKFKDVEQLLKSGKPITVESISDYDALQDSYKQFLTERKAKAMLLLPLKSKEKILGALLTAFDFPHEFRKTEMRFMTLIANLTSNALHNLHLYKQVEALSITDELTGLYNRRYFDNKISEEYSRAKRYKHNLTLLLIDIDRFKSVNDACGHNIGDEVLVEVSKTIKSTARITDIVTRYGGEEFATIMPETPPDRGFAIAEKIRVRIEQEVTKTLQKLLQALEQKYSSTITVSAGLSYYPLCKGVESLIKTADEFLYKAKQEGRNRVCSQNDKNTNSRR